MLRRILTLAVAFAPAVAIIGGLPFVNRLEPFVLGLPLLLSWIAGWVLVTPLFLGVAYWLHEPAAGRAARGGGQ